MDHIAIAALIRSEIPKSVMLDHAEVPGLARKMAADSAVALGLVGRNARRATGFDAHLVMEQRFIALCQSAGGVVIDGRVFPGTELALHQPLMRYGRVLLGRATIHERKGAPSANVTRGNGAKLNRCLIGDLFDPKTDSNSPFHVLLLTLPDFQSLDKIAATYIAVMSPTFDSTLLIEEIDDFIAGYDDVLINPEQMSPDVADFGLTARKTVQPYTGDEHRIDGQPKENT